jgi:hypothetical protein
MSILLSEEEITKVTGWSFPAPQIYAIAKAQAKKIFGEAVKQGLIDSYNDNLVLVQNMGRHWKFWSELQKEIEGK